MFLKKIIAKTMILAMPLMMSCGLYTNIPAQYHLTQESSLVATISYSGTTATVKLPKLVMATDPGSIGVDFTSMNVNYNSGDVAAENNIPISFRLDSSHFLDEKGSPIVKSATLELPIISSRVVELGRRSSVSNLKATVTLNGIDDASWSTSYELGIPIVFLPDSSTTGGS